MEQRGQWMVGFHQGASGAVLIGGEPPAFADGFVCGERAHNDSAAHRDEVSERRRESAKKRWNRNDDANAQANAQANASPFASCKTYAQDNTRQDITNKTNNSASKASPELPRAHEEPPPPAEPPTQPIADDETDDAPEGSGPSPALLAFAARLAAQRGDSAFGLGAAPVVRAPTPPAAQAPKAPQPPLATTAAEKARLEARPGDKRPSRDDFTKFASIIAPNWRNAGAIFDEWAIRNWTIPPKKDSGQRTPQRIRNWRGTLQYEIAGDDNPKHWTDMLPMGHLLSKGDA